MAGEQQRRQVFSVFHLGIYNHNALNDTWQKLNKVIGTCSRAV
jgi:hypothetical protein